MMRSKIAKVPEQWWEKKRNNALQLKMPTTKYLLFEDSLFAEVLKDTKKRGGREFKIKI